MHHPFVDQEQVIAITKFPFCLEGFVIRLKLGNLDHFGDGYVLGFDEFLDLLRRRGGRLRPVVYD